MSDDEFKTLYLSNTFAINTDNENVYLPPLNGGPLPKSVDWRNLGFVTNVKHQVISIDCVLFFIIFYLNVCFLMFYLFS